jgi:CheY-like chemotaxis protein/two-component sensor histidine kinase
METTANRVARVGHELDNALTIILSHAGLLAKRVHAPDDLDVSAIRNAARGAYALTRQLLSLERKHPGHTAAVSVDLVLEGIHRLLQRVLGERISFNVSPGQLPVSVVIDPVRLDRALVNLVLNARDAIDDRGSIHLSCEVLDNLRSEGDVWSTWVRIRAIDDGHGMSAAVAARAFEPHFTTKGAAGSGLGLAIVRETIVEAGGSITVSSTPGVGTTVELLLPATVMSPDDFPSRSATNTLGGGETIVVLEKDPAPNPSISRVLQDAGYQVLEVPGVIDGLSLPNDLLSRAALIVADEMLNDASGHELVATFRHREPGMPVLHVSSTPLAANIGRRLDARTEFLAKPFDRASLLQRVRRLIDG